MPIRFGKKNLIDAIRKGKDTGIVRVFKGDVLVFAVYEVHYYNRDEDTSEYMPATYIWGFQYDLPEIPEESPIDGYMAHPYKWYVDTDFIEPKEKILTRDHGTMNLYAKWKQKLFEFYGEWYKEGGGGDVPTRDTPPTTSDTPYPWSSSASIAMPNCTWYCYYRVQEAGATAPMVGGFGNACNWIYSGQPGYRELGPGWSAIPGETDFKPGDIICYDEISSGDGGHVAFVEGDGTLTGSWYTTLSYRDGHTAGELSDWILNGGGSQYKYRYWHNDRTPTSEFSGRIQGVLRYDGWEGGGGEEEGTVDWTEDGINQEAPSEQSPQYYGAPDGAYWTRTRKRTSERLSEYDSDGYFNWGSWSITSSNSWNTSWDD